MSTRVMQSLLAAQRLLPAPELKIDGCRARPGLVLTEWVCIKVFQSLEFKSSVFRRRIVKQTGRTTERFALLKMCRQGHAQAARLHRVKVAVGHALGWFALQA